MKTNVGEADISQCLGKRQQKLDIYFRICGRYLALKWQSGTVDGFIVLPRHWMIHGFTNHCPGYIRHSWKRNVQDHRYEAPRPAQRKGEGEVEPNEEES